MCGIAGASLSPNDKVNAKRVARAMLLAIEHRGKDATGFAFRDPTGAFQVHKDNLAATEFVKRRLCLPRAATTFIAHTRFATQGSEYFNVNNHPITTAGIVGVHNGHVSNDYDLFRDIDNALELPGKDSVRIGEVDSEAIFALLGYLPGQPTDHLAKVRGGAAVAWMNEADDNEYLHLARLSSSPLIIGQTTSGSIFFASTSDAVDAGIAAAGLVLDKWWDIHEGTYMSVLNGEFVNVEEFTPAKPLYTSWTGRRYAPITRGVSHGITDRMDQRVTPMWDDDEDFDFYVPSAHPNMTHEERAYQYIMGKKLDEPSRSNVTSLDDRLAQEEPEAKLFDDDYDELQEWLELNAAATDAAIDRDDVLDKQLESQRNHAEFAAFTRSPYLNSYYLSNVEYPVRVPSEVVHLSEPRNQRHEDSVEAWFRSFKGEYKDGIKAALDLKADVRPGTEVNTDLDGVEVFGHVVELPETFPGGDYLIRAYIPRPKRKTGYEAIFIARQYHEFDVCKPHTPAEKGTALVKSTDFTGGPTKLPAQQAGVTT